MKKGISLLILGVIMPVVAVAGETSCCPCWPSWCCWSDKPKANLVITVNPAASETDTKTKALTGATGTVPTKVDGKAALYAGAEVVPTCTLDVAAVTTRYDYAAEYARLSGAMKGTHLTLRQGVVENEDYALSSVYRDLAPLMGDIISLHFIINEGGEIVYPQMTNSINYIAHRIQKGPCLPKIKILTLDVPLIDLLAGDFNQWRDWVKGNMPGLTTLRINNSTWRS